ADRLGGHAGHHGVRRHVFGDDGAGGHVGAFVEGDAADDGGVGADAGAAFDEGGGVVVAGVAGVLAARGQDGGEDHAWSAEVVVFEGDGFVDADVVLDLDVVADDHVIGDVDVLAEAAACADDGCWHHGAVVPDLGASADRGAVVDECRLVD